MSGSTRRPQLTGENGVKMVEQRKRAKEMGYEEEEEGMANEKIKRLGGQ